MTMSPEEAAEALNSMYAEIQMAREAAPFMKWIIDEAYQIDKDCKKKEDYVIRVSPDHNAAPYIRHINARSGTRDDKILGIEVEWADVQNGFEISRRDSPATS